MYRHPPKPKTKPVVAQPVAYTSEEVCKPYLAGLCSYGKRCYNRHPPDAEVEELRRKFARTQCKWGDECRSEGCLFTHPSDGAEYAMSSLRYALPCGEPIPPEYHAGYYPETAYGADGSLQPHGAENLPAFGSDHHSSHPPSGWHMGSEVPDAAGTAHANAVDVSEWPPDAHNGYASSAWRADRQPDASGSAASWQPDGSAASWQPETVAAPNLTSWQPDPSAGMWAPKANDHVHVWAPHVPTSNLTAGMGGPPMTTGTGASTAAGWQPDSTAPSWQPDAAAGWAAPAAPAGSIWAADATAGSGWGASLAAHSYGDRGAEYNAHLQAARSEHTQYKPKPGSWAAVANTPGAPPAANLMTAPPAAVPSSRRSYRMPQELWLSGVSRIDAASAFAIADPIARYTAVNEPHARRAADGLAVPMTLPPVEDRRRANRTGVGVVDLHFQSVKTAEGVLERVLPHALRTHAEVWLVTGTGHHTDKASHQRSATGGVLHAAVSEYLSARGLIFYMGKDNNGHSGALLLPGTDET